MRLRSSAATSWVCNETHPRAEETSARGFLKESLDKPAIHRYNIHVFGPVAQLGERTVQFYAPKFGDVAQASGGWFASMPPKKSIRACSSAGRAFGSHPRGREFESLQVHHCRRELHRFTTAFLLAAAPSRLYGTIKKTQESNSCVFFACIDGDVPQCPARLGIVWSSKR